MVRRLRIAASLFFAVLTVALCVLWMRSYWVNDIVSRVNAVGQLTTFGSNSGTAYLRRMIFPLGNTRGFRAQAHGWTISAGPATSMPAKFGFSIYGTQCDIKLPYFALSLLTAVLAATPWLIRKFSLRTMFIATTVVAVIFGAVVMVSR